MKFIAFLRQSKENVSSSKVKNESPGKISRAFHADYLERTLNFKF